MKAVIEKIEPVKKFVKGLYALTGPKNQYQIIVYVTGYDEGGHFLKGIQLSSTIHPENNFKEITVLSNRLTTLKSATITYDNTGPVKVLEMIKHFIWTINDKLDLDFFTNINIENFNDSETFDDTKTLTFYNLYYAE